MPSARRREKDRAWFNRQNHGKSSPVHHTHDQAMAIHLSYPSLHLYDIHSSEVSSDRSHNPSQSSSSSRSSSGPRHADRPILSPTFTSLHETVMARPTPVQTNIPASPAAQQSSFTSNSHFIHEAYIASSEASSSCTSQSIQPHHCSKSKKYRNNPKPRPHPPITNTKNMEGSWAYEQEEKLKLAWKQGRFLRMKDLYQALSLYGSVIRISIRRGGHEADITFRPPPKKLPQRLISVGNVPVTWTKTDPLVIMVPSPIDPTNHYYDFTVFNAHSIDFGIQVSENSMLSMQTVKAPSLVQMTLSLTRRQLDVQFPLGIGSKVRKYRFALPVSKLSHMYKLVDDTSSQVGLIIPFNSPPQFYVQREEGETLGSGHKHTNFAGNETTWNEWDTWYRETDIADSALQLQPQSIPLMAYKKHAIIDIGRWTCYRLVFDTKSLSGPKYTQFSQALADHEVTIIEIPRFDVKERITSQLPLHLQEEIASTHPHLMRTTRTDDYNKLLHDEIYLPFSVRYQFEACLSNGYLIDITITRDFLAQLKALEPSQATCILEKVVDEQRIYYNPMDIFKIRIRNQAEKPLPKYCVWQRSAVITPTVIHVASPMMETSNRILRKYPADADRFIRVRFQDEKTEGFLRNMPNNRGDAAFDRVLQAMQNGIVVAGRFYEFLAFGNAQFREHGAYFYAPTSSKNADDIRLSLGQFTHIRTVAKFGARLGQCFSTTRAMSLSVNIIQTPDVERNGYNFTDGVGKISLFVAQMAAQELGLQNAFNDPPSLYQFRLGGYKGVLALDPSLTRSEVHVRPSQHKFEAEYKGLEIIRSSAFATPFFNRQVIIVLSNLGVPDAVFIRKQQEMVDEYGLALTDEKVAIKKLRTHIDMNQTTLTMASMILDGFMKDPFMMSLLRLWRACTIKNLKEKARIAIENGAFVLGCVDETATLKGHQDSTQLEASRKVKLATLPEIFLQVSNGKGRYRVIEGICVLVRNPAIHPGDIRVVRAVDTPKLRHLKNVVVLPQTGDRDLASMCSGGDLDGDDYLVMWDEDVIPKYVNVPPMNYTPEKPLETEKPITVADISSFFVTYMKNNSLGQIAHAHLAQADFQPGGVHSDVCLDLAELHSKAVDYPKTGLPATIEKKLRPFKYPHYMEKTHLPSNRSYKSRTVLGLLYDGVQLVDFSPEWDNAFDQRVLKAFEPEEELLQTATVIKDQYDDALKRLMARHGIATEFEAWSVFVLSHNNESNDYKFAEDFGRSISALKDNFRQICRGAANADVADNWSKLEPFVAAMYTITARQVDQAVQECRTKRLVGGQGIPMRLMDAERMPLMSFPWLFPSELGKIASKSSISQT